MFKRIFSLKNKYDFSLLFNRGQNRSSSHFILRYFPSTNNSKQFGIVVSGKFSKSAVTRNKIKRMIAKAVNDNLKYIPAGKYVFIPKKNILDENGKIRINVETVSTEINTLLSKMDIS